MATAREYFDRAQLAFEEMGAATNTARTQVALEMLKR
jgi:hypothetical protein